jgi:threonine dehydratase
VSVVDASAIEAAAARVAPHVERTPLRRLPHLEAGRGRVLAKLECWQTTGSFKFRGATHKLRLHVERARSHGVITASTGNHGLAVATAARELGAKASVFVPSSADPRKRAAIIAAGAQVIESGVDCVDAEAAARAASAAGQALYVPPYNDAEIVAGQGTAGVEILEQLGRTPEALVVALGGGGLIAGVATALKASGPVTVVAASPQRSPAMHECLRAGGVIDVHCDPTLSDGTAGGVEPGSITYDLCKQLVDRSELVDEAEIARELRASIDAAHLLIEGAAAVAFAVARRVAREIDGDVVVIACGANISAETLVRAIR